MARPNVLRTLSRERLNATEKVTQFQMVLVLCGIEDAGQDFLVKQGISSAEKYVKLRLDSGIKDLQKLARGTAKHHKTSTIVEHTSSW